MRGMRIADKISKSLKSLCWISYCVIYLRMGCGWYVRGLRL